MVLVESAARVAATLLTMVQTRVELAAAEVEEESLRYFSWLMLSLAAMFCVGVALVLGVMLVVIQYWDTHRTGVLLTLIALFGLAGLGMALRVRSQYRSKPVLLGHTMSELARDTDMLQPPA
jgi:uncharacterized membrane protein YqjE